MPVITKAQYESAEAMVLTVTEGIEKLRGKLEFLSSALIGSPYLITLKHEGMDLVYGEYYKDQDKTGKGFRYQRGLDLCGAILFNREQAKENISRLRKEFGDAVDFMHERDYFQAQLAGMEETERYFIGQLAQCEVAEDVTV